MDVVDVDGLRRSFDHSLYEQPWPEDVDAVYRERSADQWPVGFEEAQHSRYGRRALAERRGDALYLRLHRLHELRAVASADAERFTTRSDDATFDAQRGALAYVAFRVNYPHTGRADHEVVDVRASASDAAVVQHPEGVGQVGQALCHSLFASGTAFPCLRALRVIGEREDQPTELRMIGADSLLPVVPAAFVFTPCGRSCRTYVSSRRVWNLHRARGFRRTVDAADGFRSTLVNRVRAGCERAAAGSARAGVAKSHALVVWPQFQRHGLNVAAPAAGRATSQRATFPQLRRCGSCWTCTEVETDPGDEHG